MNRPLARAGCYKEARAIARAPVVGGLTQQLFVLLIETFGASPRSHLERESSSTH